MSLLEIQREITIRDLDSWRKVEKVYVGLRLFNVLYVNFMWYIMGPGILGIGAGNVILLYLAVRPSGLPPLIHYWVPLFAFGGVIILSWLWYDVVTLKREADEVKENLQARTHEFLRDLGPSQRKYLARRARALRPFYFTIGQFSDMTLEGLVGVWDEILNQLLFLLSL